MQKLKRKIVIIRNQSSEIVVIRTILNDIQKYTMKKKAKKKSWNRRIFRMTKIYLFHLHAGKKWNDNLICFKIDISR